MKALNKIYYHDGHPMRQVGTLWDALFSDEGFSPSSFPNTDIRDSKECYFIEMELPGVAPENVETYVDDGELWVSAKASDTENKKIEGENYLLRERRQRLFKRHFTLPRGVDSSEIQAKLTNGILSISIPKGSSSQLQKIKIAS